MAAPVKFCNDWFFGFLGQSCQHLPSTRCSNWQTSTVFRNFMHCHILISFASGTRGRGRMRRSKCTIDGGQYCCQITCDGRVAQVWFSRGCSRARSSRGRSTRKPVWRNGRFWVDGRQHCPTIVVHRTYVLSGLLARSCAECQLSH